MWAGQRSTGNSSLAIQLRQKKAAASRESQRIKKQSNVLERHWTQNFRKLGSLQRSLFVLMGKDPYSNCSREEALFEHNQPGFCYKRNGTPRFMRSLQESKSRRIVNDLEGQQGLNLDPAINVVSDTPQLAEVLSSPELVQILCELRNTAAIMSTEELFHQFSNVLENTSRGVLVGFEGPLDYLKQYRKNLIQEFFDTLKSEAEMRFFMSQDKHNKNSSFNNIQDIKSLTSDEPDILGQGSAMGTRIQSTNDIIQGINIEHWNQAVIEGLYKAQNEEREHLLISQENIDDRNSSQVNLDGLLPPLYSDKAIFLLTKKYLEESKKGHMTPNPHLSVTLQNDHKNLQKAKRREFDNFVRHLISKIEILDDMGQKLLAFKKKRPNRNSTLIEPLVKLLKKQSLFSSLTDADLLSSFYNSSVNGDPSVKYFNVSSASFQQLNKNVAAPSSETVDSEAHDSIRARIGANSLTDLATLEEEISKHVRFLDPKISMCEPTMCDPDSTRCAGSSMRKIGCKACRANVKLACNKIQKRDTISAAVNDAYTWRIPEMSNWPHDYKEIHFKDSSRSLKDRISKDKAAKLVYLVPPPKTIKYQKGAPTPRFPRRIIPPDFSAFSENQSLQTKYKSPEVKLLGTLAKSRDASSTQFKTISTASTSTMVGRPGGSRSSGVTAVHSSFSHNGNKRSNADSWTLRVSKMDIMRLRHELETESVKDKMTDFEKKFLNSIY